MGKFHRSTRGYREIKVSPDFIRDRAESLGNITSEDGNLLNPCRDRFYIVLGVYFIRIYQTNISKGELSSANKKSTFCSTCIP